MSTLSDLTAEISAQLPTGVSHEITAAKLRMVLTDMVAALSAPGTVSGGGTAERYLTSTTTAAPGDVCYCNTSAGGFTVTLPSAPIPGTGVGFRDAESSWSASNLIVAPGSNTIEGAAGNLVCDVTNGNFDLVWGGAAGWQLVVALSSGGAGGSAGGSSRYFHIISNQSITAGSTYYADTFGGSFTVTLPTGPAIGDGISLKDASGTWGLSNLIIDPGSNPINSTTSSFVIDQTDINFDLVWRGTPVGWQVEVPVDEAVRGAAGVNRLRAVQTLGGITQVLTGTSTAGAVTWNPSDKVANIVLSGGNLIGTATATVNGGVRATVAGTVGRYFEITFSALPSNSNGFGLVTNAQSLTAYPGDPNGIGIFASGYVEWPGSGSGNNWGGSFTTGDVMGIFLGSGSVNLFKNGTLVYTINTLPSGPLYPLLWETDAGAAATANFGATVMGFLPSGATSWDGSRTNSVTVVTWNPSDDVGVALSNGNLTATYSSGGAQVRANKGRTSTGYFEAHIDAMTNGGSIYIGLANASQSLSTGFAQDPNGICYFGNGYAGWVGGSGSGATYTAGDTIGVRLLSSSAEFYKNGTLQFTATGLPTGQLFPIVGVFQAGNTVTADFGATTFAHLPSGAVAWNS